MSTEYDVKDLKVAVIGCGNWGKNLIRVFHELGALNAICDIDQAKAQCYSKQYDVRSLPIEKIIQAKDVDAIVIATPSSSHFELAIQCLNANKHLFIEKPLALSVKEAKHLCQVANSKKLTLMVGHLLQYHGHFKMLKKLKSEGALGEIQYIYSNRFNFGKFPTEENVLWDYGPHDVSMVLSLMGLPTKVLATQGQYLHHTKADVSHIHLEFPHKKHAHIFVSWLHPFKEQKLVVVGSKAMAIFDDCQAWDQKLKLCSYPTAWVDGLPHPFPYQPTNVFVEPTEPLMSECRHFLTCIQEKAIPTTDGAEALRVMTVLEAATQSIAKQNKISLAQEKSKRDVKTNPEKEPLIEA